MRIDDLHFCFNDQIKLGAKNEFVFALEKSGDDLPEVQKHKGSLEELLPFLDTMCFSRFMQTSPRMPVFTEFTNL